MTWRLYECLIGTAFLGVPEFSDSYSWYTPCRELGSHAAELLQWIPAEALRQGGSCAHQYETSSLAPKLSPEVLKGTASRWLSDNYVECHEGPKEEQLCDAVLPTGWVSRLCLSFWAVSAKSGLWQVSESKYLAEPRNRWWAWSPRCHQYMRMAFSLSPYRHRTLSMKTLPIWWPKMLLKSPFPLVSCEGKHFSCTYWPFPFLPGNAINEFLNFKDWLCHEH